MGKLKSYDFPFSKPNFFLSVIVVGQRRQNAHLFCHCSPCMRIISCLPATIISWTLAIVFLQCIRNGGSFLVSSNQSSSVSDKILFRYFRNVMFGEYNWECFPTEFSYFVAVRLRGKYLNRRLAYNCNHPDSYNSFTITNQEAHMVLREYE